MSVHSRTASVGMTAPDFTLPDQAGVEFRLSQAVAQGPVILAFLRGFA